MHPEKSAPAKLAAKKRLGLACSLALLVLLACSFFTPAAPDPTPLPVPRVDQLRFKDPDTGRRFLDLDAAVRGLAAGAAWRTSGYRLGGNFYRSSWCSGAGAPADCQVSQSSFENLDQHVLDLYTLFYDQDFPQVFGLGFQAFWMPPGPGWSASFSFAEGGGSVVAQGWGVTFRQYQDGDPHPRALLSLGSSSSYPVYQSSIDDASALPLRQDLALYLSGPAAMRDQGRRMIEALAQKVKTEISAHRVAACDMQPYQGKGLPPQCKPRPMTAEEETAELARAQAYFAGQEKLLDDHYQEMYAAWINAFPFDRQWPKP